MNRKQGILGSTQAAATESLQSAERVNSCFIGKSDFAKVVVAWLHIGRREKYFGHVRHKTSLRTHDQYNIGSCMSNPYIDSLRRIAPFMRVGILHNPPARRILIRQLHEVFMIGWIIVGNDNLDAVM